MQYLLVAEGLIFVHFLTSVLIIRWAESTKMLLKEWFINVSTNIHPVLVCLFVFLLLAGVLVLF